MQFDKLVFTFFNGDIAARYLPQVLDGARVTIELGLAVIAAGLALGIVLAYLRSLPVRGLPLLVSTLVDILRALPPLVLIILLYYALPFLGVSLGAFASTWLALTLVLAAFSEEVFWAGIESHPRGVMEAARSTGLSHTQAMVHVLLPQSCRLMVAPLTNRVIAITKGTAYGSVAALNEILNQATSATSFAGNPTPLMMGALGYLVIFLPVVVAGRYIERRHGAGRH
ncbi:polar amino acid ABC transporter permease [Variovorax paradoxus]|jgi:polar amino acid transport system permease protein|uniref:amino acid ABC transporter permease n=1 Tax=Variovorax paradoxus TaxID=34073 RepID=UPI0006E5AC10|nr:polar amino acid ABC transporter permease [Variovorax paradoxus]KPV11189.1 polar amino acid ABC transporter permease [Variovorax paradoxus]KPV13098.1 polar amino acid ABC transporter permease [Variovorax paradoxus]KPV21207.1 polar amino acid ABC transporter permease [Variovorax paradoxus]KPV26819.1 polar amino acid ABC transporter permease [Variovorax paradoxus]